MATEKKRFLADNSTSQDESGVEMQGSIKIKDRLDSCAEDPWHCAFKLVHHTDGRRKSLHCKPALSGIIYGHSCGFIRLSMNITLESISKYAWTNFFLHQFASAPLRVFQAAHWRRPSKSRPPVSAHMGSSPVLFPFVACIARA
mmetsp:Transcript_1742/g.10742  ORF Transcript_1742/g.10742 Transcript_1742/m.10742 type:complete len:144 (+) Transcript_1742:2198-2629(+)